jgi:hypothetical protein
LFFSIIFKRKGGSEYMTNIGDVIRQVETTMYDTHYPPTVYEKEVLTDILYKVYTGTVEFGGSK